MFDSYQSQWYECHALHDNARFLVNFHRISDKDAERGGMRKVMAAYESDYLDVDIFTLPHHGFNTRNDFTDYTKVKTVLVTARDKTPKRREEQNLYLRERVEEWYLWGDGTKALTFPYEVGSYKTLPNFEWKYNEGQTRPMQPNMD